MHNYDYFILVVYRCPKGHKVRTRIALATWKAIRAGEFEGKCRKCGAGPLSYRRTL